MGVVILINFLLSFFYFFPLFRENESKEKQDERRIQRIRARRCTVAGRIGLSLNGRMLVRYFMQEEGIACCPSNQLLDSTASRFDFSFGVRAGFVHDVRFMKPDVAQLAVAAACISSLFPIAG